MDKWVLLDDAHIQISNIDVFAWRNGVLEICFAGLNEVSTMRDADKKLYKKLCNAVCMNMAEDGDGKNH